ncbi:MAG TPA: methyltransferase domain-containing protein [Streptosporangiaceae bacterium]
MPLWSDRSFLRDVQYQTDINLAARQSIYAYQQPAVDLTAQMLDVALPADLGGAGVVADVGCGNGLYLAELAGRGYGRRLIGADLSPGMLRAARQRTRQAGLPDPALVAADAAALPLRDSAADLTLAMHMLYHVPEPEVALGELRRVTRPGGRLVVGLNGTDHHRELRALIRAGLADLGHHAVPMVGEQLGLDQGEDLLRRLFPSVVRYQFRGRLVIPGQEPVAAYVRSMSLASRLGDPEALVKAVVSRLPSGPGATFIDTTDSGCLVCT